MRSEAASDPAGAVRVAARELAEVFRAEAAASELARQPSPAAAKALRESRVLELMLPRAHGGLELDLADFMDVGLTLGESDASLAWVANFLIEHVWWFTQFPEAFQEEVFADGPPLAAGVIAPTARVVAEDGGYRVNGRWSWATGHPCSDWLLAGGLGEAGGAGFADITLVAMPLSDLEPLDTWHVDGMCGTGSGDVVASDLFVPAERAIRFGSLMNGAGPGAARYAGPLYRTPALPILLMAVSATALGQARDVVRRGRAETLEKVRGIGPPEREKPAVQMRLARATIEVRKAELLLAATVREVEELRNGADAEARARWGAWMCEVAHTARRVVLDLAVSAGASAHFQSHPLQRTVRDLNTLCCHAALNQDGQQENLGRILLGLEGNSPF